MKETKKVCFMASRAVNGKSYLLVAEVVADIVDGKAKLNKPETGYYFEVQDNSTDETKTLRYVKQAWEAARESKKYFQRPLDTVKINNLTKEALKNIQRDYDKSLVKERLRKFAAELKALELKYNVFLRADSGEELVDVQAVDGDLGEERLIVR